MAQYNSNYTGAKIDEAIGRVLNGVSSLDILLGAYIEDTDGILYTYNAWNSSKTANSVVIITYKLRIRMALGDQECSIANSDSGMNYTAVPSYDDNAALFDFNGRLNTGLIYTMHQCRSETTSSYLAMYTYSYTFPNGMSGGFILSVGEWNEVGKYITEVSNCLTTAGGSDIPESKKDWTPRTWASTYKKSGTYDAFYWVLYSHDEGKLTFSNRVGYQGLQGWHTHARPCIEFNENTIQVVTQLGGNPNNYIFDGYKYIKS